MQIVPIFRFGEGRVKVIKNDWFGEKSNFRFFDGAPSNLFSPQS